MLSKRLSAKLPSWSSIFLEEHASQLRLLTRHLGWAASLFLLLALIFAWGLSRRLATILGTPIGEALPSTDAAVAFAELALAEMTGRWVVSIGQIALLVGYGVVFSLLWVIWSATVHWIYVFLYPLAEPVANAERRCARVMLREGERWFPLVLLIVGSAYAGLLLRACGFDCDLATTAVTLGRVVLIVVPIFVVVYELRTVWIWRMRKRRAALEAFLFSSHAIKKRFSGFLAIISFLGVVFWVGLPSLFRGFELVTSVATRIIETQYSYEAVWSEHPDFQSGPSVGNYSGWWPARPKAMADRLTTIEQVDMEKLRTAAPEVLNNLFIAFVLAGIAIVGIPVLVKTKIDFGYAGMLRKIVIDTLKSTLVVGAIELVVGRLYLQSIASGLNAGVVFGMVLGVFLAQEPSHIVKNRPVGDSLGTGAPGGRRVKDEEIATPNSSPPDEE